MDICFFKSKIMEYSEMNFIPSAMNFIRFPTNNSGTMTKPRIRKGSIPARNLSRCK